MARSTDSRDVPVEQADELELPATGGALSREREQKRAKAQFATSDIEPVHDIAKIYDKAAALAFNEEKVTVMLMDSSDGDTNPEPFVFLAVNGRGPMPGPAELSNWVPRNEPIAMARKYVEVLARAKPVHFRTVEALDAQGYKTTKLRSTAALRYPFTVIQDSNPRGAAWLAELLRRR